MIQRCHTVFPLRMMCRCLQVSLSGCYGVGHAGAECADAREHAVPDADSKPACRPEWCRGQSTHLGGSPLRRETMWPSPGARLMRRGASVSRRAARRPCRLSSTCSRHAASPRSLGRHGLPEICAHGFDGQPTQVRLHGWSQCPGIVVAVHGKCIKYSALIGISTVFDM